MVHPNFFTGSKAERNNAVAITSTDLHCKEGYRF